MERAFDRGIRDVVAEIPHEPVDVKVRATEAACVFEVTDIDESQIEPPPSVGGRWKSDYLAGIGRKGDKFVMIFDLRRLMAPDEIQATSKAGFDASVAA